MFFDGFQGALSLLAEYSPQTPSRGRLHPGNSSQSLRQSFRIGELRERVGEP